MDKEIVNPELRLAEIEVELQIVEVETKEREKTDPNKGKNFADIANAWEIYCKHMEEVWEKGAKLGREKRMLMTPEFNDVPEYADVMSLEDFIENVNCGGFIDSDGSGSYVRDGKESDISIYPSDIIHGSIRKDFDSVAWYNK